MHNSKITMLILFIFLKYKSVKDHHSNIFKIEKCIHISQGSLMLIGKIVAAFETLTSYTNTSTV